jgi:hypothetical protein
VINWLRPDVSHANDVFRNMTDSGAAVKWAFQRLRSTNVTYNDYTNMVCDDCNVYCNTSVLYRRISITKYVSKNSYGRHVGGGVTPQ